MATRAEMNERWDHTVFLLSCGLTKGQVKRELKAKYGVSARTAERYIAASRRIITNVHGVARSEMIANSVAFLQNVMRTAERDSDKIKAAESLAKLLGLNAPDKVETTVTESSPIPDQRAALMQQAANRTSGDLN